MKKETVLKRLDPRTRAYVVAMDGLKSGKMNEQEAIDHLVDSGYWKNAEAARGAIVQMQEIMFAASLPEDSPLRI